MGSFSQLLNNRHVQQITLQHENQNPALWMLYQKFSKNILPTRFNLGRKKYSPIYAVPHSIIDTLLFKIGNSCPKGQKYWSEHLAARVANIWCDRNISIKSIRPLNRLSLVASWLKTYVDVGCIIKGNELSQDNHWVWCWDCEETKKNHRGWNLSTSAKYGKQLLPIQKFAGTIRIDFHSIIVLPSFIDSFHSTFLLSVLIDVIRGLILSKKSLDRAFTSIITTSNVIQIW